MSRLETILEVSGITVAVFALAAVAFRRRYLKIGTQEIEVVHGKNQEEERGGINNKHETVGHGRPGIPGNMERRSRQNR